MTNDRSTHDLPELQLLLMMRFQLLIRVLGFVSMHMWLMGRS
jgi:hypothetical protein